MAKVRMHPDLHQAVIGESIQNPARRTRRQSLRAAARHVRSSPDVEVEEQRPGEAGGDGAVENVDDDDGSSSLSSVPEHRPKPKAPGLQRKSLPKKGPRASVGGETSLPQPKLSRQRGGNKRKHSHEYCLTCTNYGRACGGRREGLEGCAVCREPNKEKGEKLRECLWADVAAGIDSYHQARELHKKAQAAARAKVGKPPTKRQLQFLDQQESTAYLQAPDPLRVVDCRGQGSYNAVTPPVRKPLDLLPPGLSRKAVIHSNAAQAALSHTVDNHESAVRNTPSVQEQLPRPSVRQSRGIKRFVEDGAQFPAPMKLDLVHPHPSQQMVLPPSTPQHPPDQQPTDCQGLRVPYFAHEINAWVLPAYPHSNLLSPHSANTITNKAYISPYDAYPCIPIALSDNAPPRPILYQPGLPPPSPVVSITRPQAAKARLLEKIGKPVKKWARKNSTIKTIGGYEIKANGWTGRPSSTYDAEAPKGPPTLSNLTSKASSSVFTTGYAFENNKACSPLNPAIDTEVAMADVVNFDSADDSSVNDTLKVKDKHETVSAPSAEERRSEGERLAAPFDGPFELEPDYATNITRVIANTPEPSYSGKANVAEHSSIGRSSTFQDDHSGLTSDDDLIATAPMRKQISSEGSTIAVAPKSTLASITPVSLSRKRPRSSSTPSSDSTSASRPRTNLTTNEGWKSANTSKITNSSPPQ